MTFLQPWLLLALPLLAIPVIIHLLHLRRHQSTPWAAMQFLLQATKMSQGYNKLRQYLVLLARTLAIAGLVFLVARPLATGVSGWFANDLSDLAVVVLDRSPSMQMQNGDQGISKLQAAKERLLEVLALRGDGPIAVITQGYTEPILLDSAKKLPEDLRLEICDLGANVPALLEMASKYIEQVDAPKATVWIASDMRESDWRSNSPSWGTVRSSFEGKATEVRFQVLEFAPTQPNYAIQIQDCKSQIGVEESYLSLSFRIFSPRASQGGASQKTVDEVAESNVVTTIPVEVQIGQATSVTQVELVNGAAEVKELRIPIENVSGASTGYGALQIPADANVRDNVAYFAYEPSKPRRTVVVSEESRNIEAIRIAASISPDKDLVSESILVDSNGLGEVRWNETSLLVWNQTSPTADEKLLLDAFVESGGQLLLVPPTSVSGDEIFGLRWLGWKDGLANASSNGSTPVVETTSTTIPTSNDSAEVSLGERVTQWRNDTRLLSNTDSGEALPLNEVSLQRVCEMEFEGTVLAKIQSEIPWLVRLDPISDTAKGSVYAMATDTSEASSNLASHGVSLYIMVQRMIEEGISKRGNALLQVVNASPEPNGSVTSASGPDTQMVLGPVNTLSSQFFETAGAFRLKHDAESDPIYFAQNRATNEDETAVASPAALEEAFGGLKWARTDASADASRLAQEIWRWFAILALAFLLLEAVLTVPAKAKVKRAL